jgi:uncharacterized iron-regulated protein
MRYKKSLSEIAVMLGFLFTCNASVKALDLTKKSPVLLGEVHDNEIQHALRAEAFRKLLISGARPALLMEQFDRETQSEIDRQRREDLSTDANAKAQRLIANKKIAAGGWKWALYLPFIELAIEYDLPIVATNVSRVDARKVMANGLAAEGFNENVPPDIKNTLTEIILASHCGMIPASVALQMSFAQVARDQYMSTMIVKNAARGVVLLAGNGHVRRDIGIARWLPADLVTQSVSIGILEEGADTKPYDEVVITKAQIRDDPCASMRGNKK